MINSRLDRVKQQISELKIYLRNSPKHCTERKKKNENKFEIKGRLRLSNICFTRIVKE